MKVRELIEILERDPREATITWQTRMRIDIRARECGHTWRDVATWFMAGAMFSMLLEGWLHAL